MFTFRGEVLLRLRAVFIRQERMYLNRTSSPSRVLGTVSSDWKEGLISVNRMFVSAMTDCTSFLGSNGFRFSKKKSL